LLLFISGSYKVKDTQSLIEVLVHEVEFVEVGVDTVFDSVMQALSVFL
jgi:hypothetical protein